MNDAGVLLKSKTRRKLSKKETFNIHSKAESISMHVQCHPNSRQYRQLALVVKEKRDGKVLPTLLMIGVAWHSSSRKLVCMNETLGHPMGLLL